MHAGACNNKIANTCKTCKCFRLRTQGDSKSCDLSYSSRNESCLCIVAESHTVRYAGAQRYYIFESASKFKTHHIRTCSESVSGSDYDQRLYDLIRRRTLASQMAPAKLENTTITISINDGEKQNNSSRG